MSTEWGFYFAYPVLLWGLNRCRSVYSNVAIMVATSIGGFGFIALVWKNWTGLNEAALRYFGPSAVATSSAINDSMNFWLIYFSPYSRVFEFLLGGACAALYMRIATRPASLSERGWGEWATYIAVTVLVLEYLVMQYPTRPSPFLTFSGNSFGLAIPVAALLFCLARYRQTPLSRLLSTRPAIVCGEASYPIYLLQYLVLGGLFSATASVDLLGRWNLLTFFGRFILVLLELVGLAIVVHVAYERPARRWLRRRLSTRSRIHEPSAIIPLGPATTDTGGDLG